MNVYIVGGAVRDALLGMPAQDKDYVVVGSTPEQMVALGFRPVGNNFPVFLHPVTNEEYALARTERKIASGYKGFTFYAAQDVTLEQDLARRDLTMNAMAISQTGDPILIDPFNGQSDLRCKILRHVSPAFVEDPVRILRVSRFSARFSDFQVASETFALMQEMVRSGEVDALIPERVWQEVARGLMEVQPSRMLEVLWNSGAWVRIFPELDQRILSRLNDLDRAAEKQCALPVRFALLMLGVTDLSVLKKLCGRLKIPHECLDLASIVIREYDCLESILFEPNELVLLFERCDAFRRTERWEAVVDSLECTGFKEIHFLLRAWEAARDIDIKSLVYLAREKYPEQSDKIASAIHEQRVHVVSEVIKITQG